MGPFCHIGITSALLVGAKIADVPIAAEEVVATYVGGVLIDGDKVFEIWHRTIKKLVPDITARDRILHSIFAFPFAIALSWAVHSYLPLFAVLLHAIADSAIPGLAKDGRHYPPHSPWKWILCPWMPKSWYRIVRIGWPIEYPPTLNAVYRWSEVGGAILILFSALSLVFL